MKMTRHLLIAEAEALGLTIECDERGVAPFVYDILRGDRVLYVALGHEVALGWVRGFKEGSRRTRTYLVDVEVMNGRNVSHEVEAMSAWEAIRILPDVTPELTNRGQWTCFNDESVMLSVDNTSYHAHEIRI